MLHQEKHLQITKHSFRLGGKEALLSSHPNKGSPLLFSYTNCNPSLLSYHHQLQQLRLQRAAQDSKDLGFLVDVWWVSCTEQQEELDGIAWLASWFIWGKVAGQVNPDCDRNGLCHRVTTQAAIPVHPWLLLRVPGKAETQGGTVRFPPAEQRRG